MIKLTEINKYYNKGKMNEIHVINNTSITFPETGLVAITGPSGCGKTTLLNIIGGLDSFASGIIEFEDNIIKKYHPYEWDRIRNRYVGYIFQNYNLILDKTVYENVEIALNMSGLYDKKEIQERINYVLNTVGMYNYRKRNVQALSGGQQQRVAIARAIAKNPKVVLADEPTGNLDANNTFEVMSIIKKISQSCLVVLVSHERELVDFYADRVIELSDGKVVNDYENFGNRSFRHVDERDIYLKDLNEDKTLKEHGIDYYYDANKDDSLKMQIVELRDSVYIKVKAAKKVKYLADDTEIKLIDDHYKERQTHDVDEYEFDINQFGPIKAPSKRLSFIKLWDSFKQGFKKIAARRKLIGRLFLVAYFVISALVVFQLATFGNLTKIDEKDFLYTGRNLIALDMQDNVTSTTIDNVLDTVDNVEFSPYYYPIYTRFSLADYYQGSANVSLNVYPMKESWIDASDLVAGRMPQTNTEVVIDQWIVDQILESKSISDLNITEANELLDGYLTSQSAMPYQFKIVGIVDTESPVIVVQDQAIYSFIDYYLPYVPHGTALNRITIFEGRDIQSDYEVLVNGDQSQDINDEIFINGKTYIVVGKYNFSSSNLQGSSYSTLVIPDALMEDMIKQQVNVSDYYYSETYGVYFYSNNIEQALQQMSANNITAYNAYDVQSASYVAQQRSEVASRVQTVLIVLGGAVIYIFFMMRSSMLSRIKEIGTYRSIGASKLDIYKIFLGEVLAFTTIGSLSGYLIMSLLVYRVQKLLGDLISAFYLPLHFFFGGIIFIYLINVIFGMLPIFTLLRKTPSEISSKFDI